MPYTLTESNIDLMKSSIPFSELPLTFQHAMEAALYLGIRYIWIDAL